MRRLRTVSLIILAALFAVSCGGAGLPAPATQDPLAGQYIVNGGGGALDNVKALTDAFVKMHPNITWQGLADVGSNAGVNLVVSGETDLGYISRDLTDAEKLTGKVEALAIGASGTAVAVAASTKYAGPCTSCTALMPRRSSPQSRLSWTSSRDPKARRFSRASNPHAARVIAREEG